ncbi:MAG: hypothetical protein IPI34_05035 [bacterium]|nr:hypothetical protein [bacterium]
MTADTCSSSEWVAHHDAVLVGLDRDALGHDLQRLADPLGVGVLQVVDARHQAGARDQALDVGDQDRAADALVGQAGRPHDEVQRLFERRVGEPDRDHPLGDLGTGDDVQPAAVGEDLQDLAHRRVGRLQGHQVLAGGRGRDGQRQQGQGQQGQQGPAQCRADRVHVGFPPGVRAGRRCRRPW